MWRCACGTIHHEPDNKCLRCGMGIIPHPDAPRVDARCPEEFVERVIKLYDGMDHAARRAAHMSALEELARVKVALASALTDVERAKGRG